jgi:hypothetical protein
MSRTPAERGRLRGAAASALWLAAGLGGVSAALELASAARDGSDPIAGSGFAAAALSAIAAAALGAIAAALAALAAALGAIAATALGSALARWWPGRLRAARRGWFQLVMVLAAGFGLAWWLSDPPGRRLAAVYALLCLATGGALTLAAWLARERARAPEIAAAALLGAVGAAGALAVPAGTYEELQDLGFAVAVAGALAATRPLAAALRGWRRAPIAACALVLAAFASLWMLDATAPRWRASLHDSRGAARLARALRALADLDRDGASSILGGGDCDDLDSRVHPLAADPPGRGDQNCNGVDAPAAATDGERGLAPAAGDPAMAPGADLVLLITVDCWRADALDPDLMPEVSRFAAGGLRFDRMVAASTSTLQSMPLIVGLGLRGPWVADIAAAAGARVDAVVAGPVPVAAWGFPRTRTAGPAAAITDAALAVLDRPARPRLLWVHYFDLHALGQYAGELAVPGPARLPVAYRNAARHVDRAIGRLLAGLERRGLLERAVIVATGDHGEGLGAHGVSNHGRTGFEEVLRVPGLVRGPGIPAARVAGLTSHRDLPATLLGALGLAGEAAAAERFGRSWLRLRTSPAPLHRFAIAASARRVSGREGSGAVAILVDDRYKLVAGLEDGLLELYDLETDPGEQRDLAADQPAVVDRMRRQLALAWDADQAP